MRYQIDTMARWGHGEVRLEHVADVLRKHGATRLVECYPMMWSGGISDPPLRKEWLGTNQPRTVSFTLNPERRRDLERDLPDGLRVQYRRMADAREVRS